MRREDERAGHRHARLEFLLFEELAALLRDDVDDPDLSGVRPTSVTLSADMRNARVHWALAAGDRDRAERALARATPWLRAQLATSLETKRVPELRFVCDGVTEDTTEEEGGEPWRA